MPYNIYVSPVIIYPCDLVTIYGFCSAYYQYILSFLQYLITLNSRVLIQSTISLPIVTRSLLLHNKIIITIALELPSNKSRYVV